MDDATKRCPKCGTDRPLSEWGRNRANADGLQSRCNPCRKADRAANLESTREANRRYYADHQADVRARVKAWRAANRDKVRASHAAYYRANRQRWRDRPVDRERKRRGDAAYRAAHAFEIRAYQLNLRAEREGRAGVVTADQLRARLAYFGERCWICGGEWRDFDHVKPMAKGGTNWPANLRPACPGCNSAKNSQWPIDVGRYREQIGSAI